MCKEISKKDYNKCKSAIRSAIRQQFSRSDHYKAFLQSERIEKYIGKRLRVFYKCAVCSKESPQKEINVDHIKPIGKLAYREIDDARYFYDLVNCPVSNLQIICKNCHLDKNADEKENPSFENARF